MRRAYDYRGFEATIEVESVPAVIVAGSVVAAGGLVVKIAVRHRLSGRELPPVRLSDEGQRTFANEAEALMAGFSAAQRLIDDELAER
ncbi:hypothetical protein LMG28614_04152 [Paraburkholderia ultramafica]|uniref:Uncharacterized protein n=1 Tax=Paraburkholderia ultramafica TaxID=1544867 RepID=A0A6S7BC91_9BURK|nr:hypothetical protein [Paraburkholderia ultramafica]CAB3795327.1 hypothetical protein LMG28614_04152 [Paraburkholderia ultramafica]